MEPGQQGVRSAEGDPELHRGLLCNSTVCIVHCLVQVYKMGKKADGSVGDFSVAVTLPALHTTDTVGLGISR